MNVPFRVASTAALSNEHLPSPATFVLVDNTSNQWLYQPDAQRFIGPYAMNISMPLTVANGANMQVQAPPGVTQAAPIAGQQYLATFSDTAPGGYPYTSQMNVDITNGTVDATITNSSLSATITSGQVNITDTTPLIEMTTSTYIVATAVQVWQRFGSIAAGLRIHGWQASNASGGGSGGLIRLALGTAAAQDMTRIFHHTYSAPYGVTSLVLPPGLAITVPDLGGGLSYLWLYTDLGGLDGSVAVYYSAT